MFFPPVQNLAVESNAGGAALLSVMTQSVTNAGGYTHFLEGGRTAAQLLGCGGCLSNPAREFVTPGVAVPQGSVLFKLRPNVEWIPLTRFYND